MPELPEVETVRAGLDERLRGAWFTSVVVTEPRLRRMVDEASLRFLVGRTIRHVGRRGKYLVVDVGNGSSLVVHLGMSGRFVLVPTASPPGSHEHVRFGLGNGSALAYRDPRRFGQVRVGRVGEIPELARLGPDPLDGAFPRDEFVRKVRRTRRRVKTALLDQELVAGIGNIYANEILFRAGVRPMRRGVRVTKAQAGRICDSTRVVLLEAVEGGGTSFSDYVDWNGGPGRYQTRLAVFDREGLPCRVCETPIRRFVDGNRSSFYCPRCQR